MYDNMPGIYSGRILGFAVSEEKPHGRITFEIDSAGPYKGQGPDFPKPPNFFVEFKLDEDSEQSFAGMAAICARMVKIPGFGAVTLYVRTWCS